MRDASLRAAWHDAGGASRSPAESGGRILEKCTSDATLCIGGDTAVSGMAGSPQGAWRRQGFIPPVDSGSVTISVASSELALEGDECPQQQEAPWQREAHLQRSECASRWADRLLNESARSGPAEETSATKIASTTLGRVSRAWPRLAFMALPSLPASRLEATQDDRLKKVIVQAKATSVKRLEPPLKLHPLLENSGSNLATPPPAP
jgi:hypothetical protein